MGLYGNLAAAKVLVNAYDTQKGKQQRDWATVSFTRLLHDEEYCRAFMVTNEKYSSSAF